MLCFHSWASPLRSYGRFQKVEWMYEVSTFRSLSRNKRPITREAPKKVLSTTNTLPIGRNNFACLQKWISGFGNTDRFSTQQIVSMLNYLFTTIGAKERLQEKCFSALDIIFSFIWTFFDCATGHGRQPVLTEKNAVYSDTLNKRFYCTSDRNMLR